MSRNYRGRTFQFIWGRSFIEPVKKKRSDVLSYLNRITKRATKAVSGDNLNNWYYILPSGEEGSVKAVTRSEARSQIKKTRCLKKLPKDLHLERFEDE